MTKRLSFAMIAAMCLLLPLPSAAAETPEPRAERSAAPSVPWDGLVAFLADRFSGELRRTGWEERKRLLIGYEAATGSLPETALRDYRGGDGPAGRAIAEAKAALFFHMLRMMIGEERFQAAHQEFISQVKFKDLTWDDVRRIFEQQAERDLSGFFAQWVDGATLPVISLDSAAVKRTGDGFEVRIDILMRNGPAELVLPVAVIQARGEVHRETVRISGDKTSATIRVPEEPAALVLDRDYDVARRLSAAENPASIGRLLGAHDALIAAHGTEAGAYAPVLARLKDARGEQVRLRNAGDLKDKDIMSSNLILLGARNPLLSRLFGTGVVPDAGLSVTVRRNPWDPSRVVGVLHLRSADDAEVSWPELLRQQDAASVSIDRGALLTRTDGDSERGIVMELRRKAGAIEIGALRTVDEVTAAAAKKRIVYVGEHHDQFSHHTVQLQVLKELHRRDPKIAVGMEMFQRPFQGALDDFIAGTIDEREFLKRTEYFSRWVFDYNLYKPILDFCRAERIPVVALNIRREITEKVGKDGIDSLSEQERKELPEQMDFSDDGYRERLKSVFEQHRHAEDRKFEFFLQAQVLWDETMAQTLDGYLKQHPDRRMVVIAGGGHLAHGSGIPKRAFRRNGAEYAIILNDGEVAPGSADYVVFPEELEGVTAPKLMVTLREADGKVSITGFARGSAAEKAGLRKGDVILSADGDPVRDIGGLKLVLHYKKEGDPVSVKVLRRRLLFGEKEMLFTVRLERPLKTH